MCSMAGKNMGRALIVLSGLLLFAGNAFAQVQNPTPYVKVDQAHQSVTVGPPGTVMITGAGTANGVAVGQGALQNNASGISMTGVGNNACQQTIIARAGTCLGFVAGQYDNGDANTDLGAFAMRGGAAYSAALPIIGGFAGSAASNTCVGEAAGIFASGNFGANTCIGFNSLFSALDATANTGTGIASCEGVIHTLDTSCFGNGAYAFGDGPFNTFIGASAGQGDISFHFMDPSPLMPAGSTTFNFTQEGVTWAHVGDAIFLGQTTISDETITAVNYTTGDVTVSNFNYATATPGTLFLTDTTTGHTVAPVQNIGVGTIDWFFNDTSPFNIGDSVTSSAFSGTAHIIKLIKNVSIRLDTPSTISALHGPFLFDLSGAPTNSGTTPAYAPTGTTSSGQNVWHFGAGNASWAHVNDVVYTPNYAYDGLTITAINTGSKTVTVSEPSFASTGSLTGMYDIPNVHIGQNNAGLGYFACGKIAGLANNNVCLGPLSCSDKEVTGSNVICAGSRAILPATNTANYITLDNTVMCSGTDVPSTSICEVAGAFKIDSPDASGGSDNWLCWNATSKHVTYSASGCGGGGASGLADEVGSTVQVENTATNYMLKSNVLTDSSWVLTNATRATNSFISPDGSADSVTVTSSASGAAYEAQSAAISADTTTIYIASGYFTQSAGAPTVQSLGLTIGASDYTANFNISALNLGCAGSGAVCGYAKLPVTSRDGTQWYRLWVAHVNTNQTSAGMKLYAGVFPAAGSGANSYWANAQVENNTAGGTIPTSFIPTVSAAVIRQNGVNGGILPKPTTNSGGLVLAITCSAGQFVNQIDTSGIPHCAAP